MKWGCYNSYRGKRAETDDNEFADAGRSSRSPLLRARISQVPNKGFQIISGTRQEQFLHNIIGGVLVISKQWNRREQRLDFLPDSGDILLFLAQNDVRIFHE